MLGLFTTFARKTSWVNPARVVQLYHPPRWTVNWTDPPSGTSNRLVKTWWR
jgi:hypothetical protein